MKRWLPWSTSVALVLATAAARADAPATQSMSVEDCVAYALQHSPDVVTHEAQLSAAQADAAGAEGQFGPKIHVDANFQQWDGFQGGAFKTSLPFDIPFGGQNFEVRSDFTWLASVTVTQPLLDLWPIFENYKLKERGVDVAKIRSAASRRDVAFEVTRAYLIALEQERLSEVASTSLDQLNSQLKESQSLYANGVVSRTDVLRAEVAVANARQRSIGVKGAVSVANARLAAAMGWPAGTGVEPRALTGEPPARATLSVDDAEARAIQGRVELREIDARLEQAQRSVSGAQAGLVPRIELVANYTHNAGSAFVQPDPVYFGANASWDVWDWGTTINGIHQADAHVKEVVAARTKVEQDVRLDARQAYVDLQTAADAMDTAKATVASAEENYRLVSKRYEAAAATEFDVIDAEALLTQARGQQQTSLYDYLIASAALDRSAGIAPNAPRGDAQ